MNKLSLSESSVQQFNQTLQREGGESQNITLRLFGAVHVFLALCSCRQNAVVTYEEVIYLCKLVTFLPEGVLICLLISL